MLCLKMLNFVKCAILLYITIDVAQSRFVYRPDIQREIQQDKVVATWHEAKEHCESLGAILASPIDSAHLNYMRDYIEVNDHTSAYFTGFKAVIHDGDLNYISVEGITLDELPEAVIDMIEKIDPEDGNCLSMDRREIRAAPCWERLPYICYTKVPNVTPNVPVEVTSSLSTVVNTKVMTNIPGVPDLSSYEPASTIMAENVFTEVTTGVPVEVTPEEIPEVSATEPNNIIVEATTETSIELSSSEPDYEYMSEDVTIDTTTEESLREPVIVYGNRFIITDSSVEVSSYVPPVDMVTEVTLDVSSNEPLNRTDEMVEVTTVETASYLPNVPVETTETKIDVRMNNADDGEDRSGYSYYDTGSLYKVHDAPLPWTNANATCTREGGYLAVINDDAEARVLAELGDIYPHVVWIGLKTEHGDWRSVQGDSLAVIFNKWSIVRANYECGVIMSTGVLDDRDCEYPLPFICEKNPVPIDAEVY